jgi:hypothetical protein
MKSELVQLFRYIRNCKRILRGMLPCAGGRRRVLMLHVGRSGSTVLGDLLNQHPDIFWDSELLLPVRLENLSLPAPLHWLIMREPFLLIRSRMWWAQQPIYGFETTPHHLERLELNMRDYLHKLHRLGFMYFVVLQRKNYLRVIVSLLIAIRKSRWQQTEKMGGPVREPIYLPLENTFGYNRTLVENLTFFADFFDRLDSIVDDLDVHILRLTYEQDINGDPTRAYRRFCGFLGIAPHDVAVRYNKVNPFLLSELIVNFEEVACTLADTRFGWMLEG